MQYTCKISGEYVFCYFLTGEIAAKFDTDTFLLSVISPLQFKQFERNPDKVKFNIRKLELNNYNLISKK